MTLRCKKFSMFEVIHGCMVLSCARAVNSFFLGGYADTQQVLMFTEQRGASPSIGVVAVILSTAQYHTAPTEMPVRHSVTDLTKAFMKKFCTSKNKRAKIHKK